MKLKFKFIAPNEKQPHKYTYEFKNSLDLIRFGDKQTVRMLNALELLYSALCNNVILITCVTQRNSCLDFVDAFTELSQTDKDKRTTRQWKRVTRLASHVASDLGMGLDPFVSIQFAEPGHE
ncbi:hypothetical protein HNO86_08450 [Pseudomonas sp. C1C7]|uniref:hypothetical protein n=1 Tax=Pseudomonas sp. C1C7 TaxID=2735272 RepID=UPI0015869A33|nr:hypothetical protein [Pseudomonas sp. C1C7]NUT75067.1 hypothetical protein [Pseudomonas sp. C1C7]